MTRASTRRSFLRAVGASLATLPFLSVIADSVAEADDKPPLKFITLYHPHGIVAEYWAMRSGETETNFDIKYQDCSLQPFDDPATYGKSFKDKVLIIEGMDILSAANGHDTAGTILTGSRIDGKKPQNVSLDQFLAVDKGLGADTRVASVALGVGTDSSDSGVTLSYGAGGAPLPKLIDPVQAFDYLFTGLVVGDDPDVMAKAQRQRELGMSVIDFVRGDVTRLQSRLSATEQRKLDQHLTALREMEKQFSGSLPGMACTIPAKPDSKKFPSVKQYNGGEPYFDAITEAHMDLLAQAIACGVTRFATLLMNDLSFANNPLGLPADNHGAVAHTYDASPLGKNGTPRGDGNPATWLPLAKLNKYSYAKVAGLMKRLDALGMLDSTLIYMTSDMGNPAIHSTRNVPTVLAGGVNGKFKMGRRLKLQADCPTRSPWCGEKDTSFTPVTNNKLLVSIAQAFDVAIDSFGTQSDPKNATGGLSGLT